MGNSVRPQAVREAVDRAGAANAKRPKGGAPGHRNLVGGFLYQTGVQLALALGAFSISPWKAGGGAGAQDRNRALVLLPLIGLLQGVTLALVDRSLSGADLVARSTMVVAIGLVLSKGIGLRGVCYTLSRKPLASGQAGRAFAWILAVLTVLLEVYCLSRIAAAPWRGRALVLAMMLSRWSVVPIAYGLKATGADGLGIRFDGAITFGDFAISSVIALGPALAAYDFVALIVIVTLAPAIVGLRFLFSRWFGGVDGFALGAGAQLCELATIGALCVIRL
jgi:adenosylcobinamide-GDP ribazoletransferase